jgi:putative intracellular protease/amidase
LPRKVGFIVFDHFAIWQVSLLQMFLHNAGFEIETISINGGLVVTDGEINVSTESIENKDPNSYELLLLPGGEVTSQLLSNKILQGFLQEFDGFIAASCASSVLLAAAGLIKGDYTTMPHIKEQFSEYYSDGRYMDTDIVVRDKMVTSKGFAHFEFMMAVLNKLGITEKNSRIEVMALKLSRNQSLVK